MSSTVVRPIAPAADVYDHTVIVSAYLLERPRQLRILAPRDWPRLEWRGFSFVRAGLTGRTRTRAHHPGWKPNLVWKLKCCTRRQRIS
jgi:hypothetical protein